MVVSKRVRARSSTSAVVSRPPGSAREVSRAARLIVSPMTLYDRQDSVPMSPQNAGPRLTPARSVNPSYVPRTVRSARSMRSSSAPVDDGAPPTM